MRKKKKKKKSSECYQVTARTLPQRKSLHVQIRYRCGELPFWYHEFLDKERIAAHDAMIESEPAG